MVHRKPTSKQKKKILKARKTPNQKKMHKNRSRLDSQSASDINNTKIKEETAMEMENTEKSEKTRKAPGTKYSDRIFRHNYMKDFIEKGSTDYFG